MTMPSCGTHPAGLRTLYGRRCYFVLQKNVFPLDSPVFARVCRKERQADRQRYGRLSEVVAMLILVPQDEAAFWRTDSKACGTRKWLLKVFCLLPKTLLPSIKSSSAFCRKCVCCLSVFLLFVGKKTPAFLFPCHFERSEKSVSTSDVFRCFTTFSMTVG